jgi:hypothetical protein
MRSLKSIALATLATLASATTAQSLPADPSAYCQSLELTLYETHTDDSRLVCVSVARRSTRVVYFFPNTGIFSSWVNIHSPRNSSRLYISSQSSDQRPILRGIWDGVDEKFPTNHDYPLTTRSIHRSYRIGMRTHAYIFEYRHPTP